MVSQQKENILTLSYESNFSKYLIVSQAFQVHTSSYDKGLIKSPARYGLSRVLAIVDFKTSSIF